MRSPDDTFYNIKRLHVWFAVSAVALVAVTIWMVARDHAREWKVYQRMYRDRVEPWTTEAALRDLEEGEYREREQELARSLNDARQALPDRALVDQFIQEAGQGVDSRRIDAIRVAYQALAQTSSAAARDALLNEVSDTIAAADLGRAQAERQLRFRRAEFEEARSDYELAIGRGLSSTALDRLEIRAAEAREAASAANAAYEQATRRSQVLSDLLRQMRGDEDSARRALDSHRAARDRFERLLAEQQPTWAKKLLRLPMVEAFGRTLAIDQTWLPELTLDYNFRDVARFDRCATCHQGIDRTAPGSAADAAYLGEHSIMLELVLPDEPPGDGSPTLETVYGMSLAARGILDPRAVTVGLVLPRSRAADARLMAGDVILAVDDAPIADGTDLERLLLGEARWGEPVELHVRRGLPHPYSSHPRLDLFVGEQSPHPRSEFGCTICHDGQGSATAFANASHTPNGLLDRRRWQADYGWSRNEFWDLAMRPDRFAESNCLKCHHNVTELEPSRRFPDPPARKLLQGYNLVRQHGCFGCHEIKGVGETLATIGPDLRLEPNYHEAASQLLATAELNDEQRRQLEAVVRAPDEPAPRRDFLDSLVDEPISGAERTLAVLRHQDASPGQMRKVGSSLRHAAEKLDAAFIEDYTAQPTRFRPESRMPQLFGLHEHLEGRSLADARRFEVVELRAISHYLLSTSQDVEPLPAPPGVTEPPSAERGRGLFQTQGCLACHKHAEFPAGQSVFGPDLTSLGSKLITDAGRAWLASWIRDPARHSPRTLMPNPLLEPQPLADSEPVSPAANPLRQMTDPAADIAAFLLESNAWKASPQAALIAADLDELAVLHLSKAFPRAAAEQYVREGLPESLLARVDPDTAELVAPITQDKKLRYVGRRTIRKRGCFGCHDVPGFEDAQLIGPALSDWGRKQESLLAFEQVHRFVERQQEDEGAEAASDDEAFYKEALHEHRREGFLWQKLRAPRSFDFAKTENKTFNEWLLMGRFALAEDEIEAIATFVLGLVAEPPASKYVWQGDPRRRAIADGRKVLDKYGCAECHTLEMERWRFEYDPEEYEPPANLPTFDFVTPRATPPEVAASLHADRRGLTSAEVVGMPQVDASGELVEDVDDEDRPLYFFNLWEPAVLAGEVCTVGGAQALISEPQIVNKRLPWGGAYARLLYPVVVAEARRAGTSASETEAWGWVPPPLVHEGRAVRPEWLHQYLLDPYPIRPAAVLRMPKYNLSTAEAAALVDYFAASSGAAFPYESDARARTARLEDVGEERLARLEAAMRVLTDAKTYCAKCHLIGDYTPGGEIATTIAPRLDRVGDRLRPEYVRRWLADPKSVLPYTAMPVNFPPTGEPMGQDLFPGTSIEQLDAVVDLLLHYDWYLSQRTSVREMVAEPDD